VIRAVALFALLAWPTWADTSHNETSVDVAVAAADGPHVAVVSVTNHFRRSVSSSPFDLEVDGLRVRVTVNEGRNTLPDIVTVEAPEGFIAVPMSVELDEGQSGEILIYAIEGVGM